jgi:hypothetical protein
MRTFLCGSLIALSAVSSLPVQAAPEARTAPSAQGAIVVPLGTPPATPAAPAEDDDEPKTAVPAVEEIHRRLLTVGERWGRLRVAREGNRLDLGFFNQRAPDMFNDTPAAKAAASASYDYRVGSFITGLLAGAVYLADFGYVAGQLGRHQQWHQVDTAVSLSMLGGGLLLHATSSLLNGAANNRLGQAVGLENEHMVQEILHHRPRVQAGLVPVHNGALAAFSYAL